MKISVGHQRSSPADIDEVRLWGRALSLAEVQTLLLPLPTSVSLASLPNPSVAGSPTTLTAIVGPVERDGDSYLHGRYRGRFKRPW